MNTELFTAKMFIAIGVFCFILMVISLIAIEVAENDACQRIGYSEHSKANRLDFCVDEYDSLYPVKMTGRSYYPFEEIKAHRINVVFQDALVD